MIAAEYRTRVLDEIKHDDSALYSQASAVPFSRPPDPRGRYSLGFDDKGIVALDGIGDRAPAPHRCYAGYEMRRVNARPQAYDLSTAGFRGVSSTQGTG